MNKDFKKKREKRRLPKIYIWIGFILFAIVYSFLDYFIKYTYTHFGKVQFYRVDFHFIFFLHWLITPLVLFPFVKYFNQKIKERHSYIILGAASLLLSFFVSMLIFLGTRWIYGSSGLDLFSLLYNSIDRTISIGAPATFVFLVYFYITETERQRRQLAKTEKALMQSEIEQLKANFEPHFLFNNLNILSELVEEDIHKSQEFIQALSGLYRYIVSSNKKNVVRLSEELKQAKNYLNIINIKYHNIFQLTITNSLEEEPFILPNTLQILIENVVKHNRANKHSLMIEIHIEGNNLRVINDKRTKPKALIDSTGIGLQNLKERYRLLFDRPIVIKDDDAKFEVKIPLLKH